MLTQFKQATVSFVAKPTQKVLVVGVEKDAALPSDAYTALKPALSPLIATLRGVSEFDGAHGSVASVGSIDSFSRVFLLGTHCKNKESKKPEHVSNMALGKKLMGTMACANLKSESGVSVWLGGWSQENILSVVYGLLLQSWRFDRYLSADKEDPKEPFVGNFEFVVNNPDVAESAFKDCRTLAESIAWGRAMLAEPANVCNPQTVAEELLSLEALGVDVKIIDADQLKKMGANCILAVGQASAVPPRMVVLQWKGDPSSEEAPIALVGKGVTFDTGGLSIKTGNYMVGMKGDKGGALVVSTVIRQLALTKAKKNVVAVVPLVENSVSGNAYRPDDILISLSGQSVCIGNTDAEGRVILADALWYAKETFKPKAMVDVATLTGAIVTCLGDRFTGLFTSDDALAETLTRHGKDTGEEVWRMPLDAAYDAKINNDIADMQNIGQSGYGASSSTAAQFLKRFVGDVSWAHLDIAGSSKIDDKGGRGQPSGNVVCAQLLYRWVLEA